MRFSHPAIHIKFVRDVGYGLDVCKKASYRALPEKACIFSVMIPWRGIATDSQFWEIVVYIA